MVLTEEERLLIMVLSGTFGMFLLVLGIVIFFITYKKKLIKQQLEMQTLETEHQLKLLQGIIQTQENERKRFAEDLHDEVGAMLSTAKLNIARIERSADKKAAELATETKSMLNSIITNIRRIAKDLLPSTLEKLGFIEAIKELCNSVNKSSIINASFEEVGKYKRQDIKIELALYRVVQELVNNALKHANATEIKIVLKCNSKQIELEINDNGQGFDLEQVKESGLGLRNIESRINMIDGKLDYFSEIDKGTTAKITIDIS